MVRTGPVVSPMPLRVRGGTLVVAGEVIDEDVAGRRLGGQQA